MSIISEIFGSIFETLEYILTEFYTHVSMAYQITLWILFFRNKLKYRVAVTAAGLYLSHVVFKIVSDLVFMYFFSGPQTVLYNVMLSLYFYLITALGLIWFKHFVRAGWHRVLLVYFVMAMADILANQAVWLVDIGISALGLPMLNYWGGVFVSAAVYVISGIALYRLLNPRLQRVESREPKWLWTVLMVSQVAYDLVWVYLIHIYFERNNIPFDAHDPVYQFFATLLIVLILLLLSLIFVLLDNISKNVMLRSEAALKDRLLDLQREQYERITENAEAVKAQWHDLRHQLAVIKHYNDSGDAESLGSYLDQLTAGIPSPDDQALCENFAVNAVARYYYSLAAGAGIKTSVQLSVPQKTGRVRDSDLCVIVGNLFENAIEACQRQTSGERFIQMNIHIRYDTLTITMDNSFDGKYKELDGVFFSQKRDGAGTGLSSVRTVARKYGGNAKFEVKGSVFMSSAYVDISEPAAALSHKLTLKRGG